MHNESQLIKIGWILKSMVTVKYNKDKSNILLLFVPKYLPSFDAIPQNKGKNINSLNAMDLTHWFHEFVTFTFHKQCCIFSS